MGHSASHRTLENWVIKEIVRARSSAEVEAAKFPVAEDMLTVYVVSVRECG
jgi:hypothetical protein